MAKTIHFVYGCPWADGEIQMADTDQRCSWLNVTCKHCLTNKESGYGRDRRAESWSFEDDGETHSEEYKEFVLDEYGDNKKEL
jgi:hypothetical protein